MATPTLDKVGYYSRAWKSNNTKCEADRQREKDNWKFVSGVNFGQWPTTALELLQQEGRPATQFNFIQGKVLSLAGSFMQNPLETKFESEIRTGEWGAQLLNHLFLYNKDRGNWSYAKAEFILAMLTYRGVLEMYKDYKNSPLGDIGLRYVNPFTISFDHRWQTSNLDDCKRIYTSQKMDAEDIASTFKKKSEEITEAVRRVKELLDDPSEQNETIDKIADRSPEFYDVIGNQYTVIQILELKRVSRDRLFDIRTREYLPFMSKDVAKALLAVNGNAEFMRMLPDETKELRVTTICPGLSKDLILEDGLHPLQIGSYPYIVASALNLHGEAQGVVDVMKDPQMTINKRESTFTHWQSTAVNGVETVEEGVFSDEEFLRYKAFKNKPGETFRVAEGTNSKKGIMARDRGNPPNDQVESVNRAIGHMDRMWSPPAVQGLEGKSGESGDLFDSKKAAALVSLEFMNRTLTNVDAQIGEKFFGCVKIIYKDDMREVGIAGKASVFINEVTEFGKLNDISQLPRIAIRVTQSQSGISMKRERMNLYSQYGQVVTTPVMKAVLELMMIDVIPGLPDAQKEEIKEVQNEFIQLLRMRTAAEMAQLAPVIQSAGAPTAPAGGPSEPGSTPMEGGGFSPEGKPIPPAGGNTVDVRAQNQLK